MQELLDYDNHAHWSQHDPMREIQQQDDLAYHPRFSPGITKMRPPHEATS